MFIFDRKSNKSISEQIVDLFSIQIINGDLGDDEKLPSVRELARILTINPNTILKAYRELELLGYIYSIKGKGYYAKKQEKENPKYLQVLSEYEKIVEDAFNFGVEKKVLIEIIEKVNNKKECKSNKQSINNLKGEMHG